MSIFIKLIVASLVEITRIQNALWSIEGLNIPLKNQVILKYFYNMNHLVSFF